MKTKVDILEKSQKKLNTVTSEEFKPYSEKEFLEKFNNTGNYNMSKG